MGARILAADGQADSLVRGTSIAFRAVLLTVAIALGGCAAPTRYVGIDPRSEKAPADLGPKIAGLDEAQVRLAALQDDGRGTVVKTVMGGSPAQPDAATIEEAYLRWVNRACTRLIDLCTDGDLVFADMFHAENVKCQVHSTDALCAFDIRTNHRRERCRGRFMREQRGQGSHWVTKWKDVKPRTFEADIDCNQD